MILGIQLSYLPFPTSCTKVQDQSLPLRYWRQNVRDWADIVCTNEVTQNYMRDVESLSNSKVTDDTIP